LAQKYKPGQTLNCMILDIDISKKIADLKEISGKSKDSGKELKAGQKIKAVVELSKDGFCILAFKTQRNSLALMIN
jgi:ribosomal protein S1